MLMTLKYWVEAYIL